ncbi:MAG: PEP-utilizing enzyme [Candidatus Moranbacteria bacterium]|nr:PEP-utilizing enzyme [Candidatus Moranbacteria bacterium]
MISFQNSKYELLFSNQLPPLTALNYADELFFQNFEELCGSRYRILSIIKNGWQQKFGKIDDLEILKQNLLKKIANDKWINQILAQYESSSIKLRDTLSALERKEYKKISDAEIIDDLEVVRKQAATLDAMSNLLHLFSSLIGSDFLTNLHKYSNDIGEINANFIFYTQPIHESRFAKISSPDLQDKIKLSDRDKNFSTILRVGTFIKDDVSELLDSRKRKLLNLFASLANRLRCEVDDIEYLQINEIKEALNKKIEIKKIIDERHVLTVLFYPDNKLNIFSGSEAKHFLEKGNFKEIGTAIKTKELRGQTASLGKASGRAIVAQDSAGAIEMIASGDILIVPYTGVEYLPAMRKASAIITETGGITSHAAIVSREFKIPCIIGVKDATKILKTGEYVEVDADNGIIKIL